MAAIDPDWAAERRQDMVRRIGEIAAGHGWLTGCRRISPRILAVMAELPRHEFVPDDLVRLAYVDGPLPIGHGQTISQPFIVALMTHLLELGAEHKVLEIGTGSGYQTAVLAHLARRLYSIELVADLAREAAGRLARLGAGHACLRQGDGHLGWPEKAPFDRILVTAAPRRLPPALIEQLAPEGRLVAPVGPIGDQELALWSKDRQGAVRHTTVLPVAFVPLVGPA